MLGIKKFTLNFVLVFFALTKGALAADTAEKIDMETSRYFVVARTFPERIFIPANKDKVLTPLQKLLDSSLMPEESLVQLRNLPGIEVVQGFAQEKWRNRPSKQEFVVWGITDQFLKGFRFGNVPVIPATGILVTSKMMQRLAWKDGEQITMEEPSSAHHQLAGQAFGYDTAMSRVIAKGDDLALVPLELIMRDANGFILNPCLLVRLKPNANLATTRAVLEEFVTKQAKPTLKGSVLQLKSLNGFVR